MGPILLLACSSSPLDSGESKLRIPDMPAPEGPGRTVVWFTIDTLNQDHVGPEGMFGSTPNHDAIFEEGVLLPNTVVTRGVTVISLPSIATGTYPRTHRVDDKDIPAPAQMPEMVQERLQDNGWVTFGYSSNICVMQNRGWKKTLCIDGIGVHDGLDDQERDEIVIEAFLEDLAKLPPERDAFFWLHLKDPHSDYSAREPWISDYYDGDYKDRSPITGTEVNAITLGYEPPEDDFQSWFDAVYASQVASTDEMLGRVRQALEDADRWDIVFTGTDHGEENGAHHDYYQHGCSTYEPVLNTTWSFRAPGVEPAVIEERVSTTDMLPTLWELLGEDIPEAMEGRSLLSAARGETSEVVPVYFERGYDTAGVVLGTRKYFLHGGAQVVQCSPFDEVDLWPGPEEGLFDLAADPEELHNLVETEPDSPEKDLLCEWVTGFRYGENRDAAKTLIHRCEEHLAE